MADNINENDLENVSGGYVNELADLMKAAHSGSVIAEGSAHVPGFNKGETVMMKNKLRSLGIDAQIDLGVAGTGLYSGKNKYTNIATGESMTHAEVLAILQANS